MDCQNGNGDDSDRSDIKLDCESEGNDIEKDNHDDDDDDKVCEACLEGDSFEDDEIIFCDGEYVNEKGEIILCDAGVHQGCYGINVVPEGEWYHINILIIFR